MRKMAFKLEIFPGDSGTVRHDLGTEHYIVQTSWVNAGGVRLNDHEVHGVFVRHHGPYELEYGRDAGGPSPKAITAYVTVIG